MIELKKYKPLNCSVYFMSSVKEFISLTKIINKILNQVFALVSLTNWYFKTFRRFLTIHINLFSFNKNINHHIYYLIIFAASETIIWVFSKIVLQTIHFC